LRAGRGPVCPSGRTTARDGRSALLLRSQVEERIEHAARASLVPVPQPVARLEVRLPPTRGGFGGRRARQPPRDGLEAPVVVRPIALTAHLAKVFAADFAGPEVHEYSALAVVRRPNAVEALVTATHTPCQRPGAVRFAAIAQISTTEDTSWSRLLYQSCPWHAPLPRRRRPAAERRRSTAYGSSVPDPNFELFV
jgi:hypothetical protein